LSLPIGATKPAILARWLSIRHLRKAIGNKAAWLGALVDFARVFRKYSFGTSRFQVSVGFLLNIGLTASALLGGLLLASFSTGIVFYFGASESAIAAAFLVTTVFRLVIESTGGTLGGWSWNNLTQRLFGPRFSAADGPMPTTGRRRPEVPKIDSSPPSPPLGAHAPKPKPSFYPPPPPWGGGPGGGVPVSGPAPPPPPPPPAPGGGPTTYAPPPPHGGAVATGPGGVSMQVRLSAGSFRAPDRAELEYLSRKKDRVLEQAQRHKPEPKR
jgi:hypothetical protein